MELTGDVVEIGDGSRFVVGDDLERSEAWEDFGREKGVGEQVLIIASGRELDD